ncbi:low molecular weight phosphotyrosine protein phosphatase [Oxalobacter sp. OttesenSCG-928-P03]|nr:low molecular weight phosphotyrosine protein phosphatase [Oxalobacter sp. OttesenSCG-928-P03]
MINHILVLCLGNICRSPMAEGLLKEKFPEKTITSAGLRGMTGWTADPSSIRIMAKHGIDITSHRGRNLTRQMVEEADLILTMEEQQTRTVESRFPEAKGKIMRLGEYGNYDIADPFNRSIEFFKKTYELIEKGVDQLIRNHPGLN